ncbi:MAG: LLM class flavin-dependent oxidoreductase [Chloroflexi bacterium]|nr:LLM class flavin-dependent oxidoreductase [Chloroflexota bacterium]
MKFGLTLPNRGVLFGATTPAQLLDIAQKAEACGLWSTIWVGDSLVAKPRLESITLLSAIAAVTSRVRLGPACLASFTTRHPVQLAIQWASLDLISQGRTILCVCLGGAGNGDWGTEARILEIERSQRLPRFEEGIHTLRELWTQDRVDHHGDVWNFEDYELLPKPFQKPCPPIWIANNPHTVGGDDRALERSFRRVARLADGWMTHSVTPEEFERRWARVQSYAAEEGRKLADDATCLYHNINVNPDVDAAMAETKKFLDLYYTANFTPERIREWCALGSVDDCVAQLRAWRSTTMGEITMRLCSWDQQRQFDLVVNDVLPRVLTD